MTALPRPERRILSAGEAADYLGYSSASTAFREYVASIGVKPLRQGAYDRVAIDRALDEASGVAARVDYEAANYG